MQIVEVQMQIVEVSRANPLELSGEPPNANRRANLQSGEPPVILLAICSTP